MQVIVPKAKSEWARWQAALPRWKDSIVWHNPWRLERLAHTEEMKQIWLNIDQFKVVECVSPEAANVLVEQLDHYWPMPPTGVNWLCNGPGTAQVLEAFGLSVRYPESGYTAEDVIAIAAPLMSAHDSILVVKGEGGRNVFKEYFQSTGQKYVETQVYSRSIDKQILKDIKASAQKSDAIWLSSSALGEAMLNDDLNYWRTWAGQFWVSSERLLHWCNENGLTNIALAADASVNGLAAMLHKQQGEL